MPWGRFEGAGPGCRPRGGCGLLNQNITDLRNHLGLSVKEPQRYPNPRPPPSAACVIHKCCLKNALYNSLKMLPKPNSAVRQVNARFEVGFGRRGVSRRAPPLTLSANALYVGQVVTWTAAKLPH